MRGQEQRFRRSTEVSQGLQSRKTTSSNRVMQKDGIPEYSLVKVSALTEGTGLVSIERSIDLSARFPIANGIADDK